MLAPSRAVAVDVDRLAALLRELDRELEREAVRGGERERLLARDRVLPESASNTLRPRSSVSRKRSSSAFTTRSISLGVLDTSGYHGPTCSTTIAREAVDVLEADPARLHDGTTDQPAAGRSRGPRSRA